MNPVKALVLVSLCAAGVQSVSRDAEAALTLPDRGASCPVGFSTGGAGCIDFVANNPSHVNSYGLFVNSTGDDMAILADNQAGGLGVMGEAYASGTGVVGDNFGTGYGVRGLSQGGNGVWGRSMISGTGGVGGFNDKTSGVTSGVHGAALSGGYGVFGDAPNGGWAGYFTGNVAISGGNVRVGANTTVGTPSNFFRTVYAASISACSDARLKKDVRDLPYGLHDLLNLRPVTFRWRKDGPDGQKEIGLIAQELEKVIPEIVSRGEGESGTLSIDYQALVPVVIKAVQERQQRIDRLRKERAPLSKAGMAGDVGWGALLGALPLAMVSALRERRRRSKA